MMHQKLLIQLEVVPLQMKVSELIDSIFKFTSHFFHLLDFCCVWFWLDLLLVIVRKWFEMMSMIFIKIYKQDEFRCGTKKIQQNGVAPFSKFFVTARVKL